MADQTYQGRKQRRNPDDTVSQRKSVVLKDNRAQSQQGRVLHDARPTSAQLARTPVAESNHTGLPDQLKAGIESLSGMNMDHVNVHYNSNKPAQLNAHAYAQGSQIHLASGQEKHLPHEAWHVVQQAQGRVKPTMQMKGNVGVNDDRRLEREADVMGDQAAQMIAQTKMKVTPTPPSAENKTVQRVVIAGGKTAQDIEKQGELEPGDIAVLRNWDTSKTLHHFPDEATLLEAIERAKSQQELDKKNNHFSPSGLYHKDNLKFLTTSPDRLPTLYFKTAGNNDSGRIRQQHASGPLVKSQTGKIDYFFLEKEKMLAFRKALRNIKKDAGKLKDINVTEHGGSLEASEGAYHLEVTYKKDADGNIVEIASTHPSGGTVALSHDTYSQEKIEHTYKQATGQMP
ncbi:DUF4157 domain-containing protein [Pseudomonas sp. MWU13-2105]|uniref:eCIS core domain-containing protein n=1 Tax=Pseudomonas sp. MWU13-2105 TaxID=2935074 RepID=UPI00200C60A8|nr:DUF4157 domain-containing protein [Pseudomonas sp. MWU13-2105]